MSNRYFNQFQLAMEKKVESIFAEVTFAGGGAPTLVTANSKGIISVEHLGVGKYSFVFGSTAPTQIDTYYKLLGVNHVFQTTGAAPAAPGMVITDNSTSIADVGSMDVVFMNAAGVATDPADTEKVFIEFKFCDSNSG